MRKSESCGNYELVELLGRGGMGEVWRGRHAMLGREAAVKLIRPSAIGSGAGADLPTLRARFEREARATSALSSPHTVDLFDFGVSEDGSFFYAMELLDGVDLQTLVERSGPLPAPRAVHLLAQVCESLAEAHHRGLVHRDVKPANAFCCRVGLRVDHVKVLDFGLVRTIEPGDDAQLTAEGVAAGSPAFMAPEVIRGEADVDHRADVYAFGCLAFWLLTGGLVFPGKTSLQMVLGHIERAPPPPSSRVEGLPAELDEVVLACLAKRPADRPDDLLDVAARLAAAVAEPWTDAEAQAWWAEHEPGPSWRPAPAPAPDHRPDAPPDITAEFFTAPLDPAELKAGRKRTVDALRSHYASSHISVEVFEDRSARALRAATPKELDELVEDLPKPKPEPARAAVPILFANPVERPTPAPATADVAVRPPVVPAERSGLPAPRGRDSHVSVFSSVVRKGDWRPARRSRALSVFGETRLDFTETPLPEGLTEVHCTAIFGSVRILVPPELYVEADATAVLGAFTEKGQIAPPPAPGDPWLRITGFAMFGEIEVKVVKPKGPGFISRALDTLAALAAPPPPPQLPAPEDDEAG